MKEYCNTGYCSPSLEVCQPSTWLTQSHSVNCLKWHTSIPAICYIANLLPIGKSRIDNIEYISNFKYYNHSKASWNKFKYILLVAPRHCLGHFKYKYKNFTGKIFALLTPQQHLGGFIDGAPCQTCPPWQMQLVCCQIF